MDQVSLKTKVKMEKYPAIVKEAEEMVQRVRSELQSLEEYRLEKLSNGTKLNMKDEKYAHEIKLLTKSLENHLAKSSTLPATAQECCDIEPKYEQDICDLERGMKDISRKRKEIKEKTRNPRKSKKSSNLKGHE